MNYARFYALLHRLPMHDDSLKERLVARYTNGRTTSLRQMTGAEYNTMCDAMETSLLDPNHAEREALRKRRSEALHLMQRLGIDTADWARINAFCRDARIVGKVFAALGPEELGELTVKLRGIERRGGLNPQQTEPKPVPRPAATKEQVIYMPLDRGPIC
ncbi:hypothetical protein [Alistipes sp.]|uniref:hypothetical protein n=1 Tax=Alistipes sp. TaxID=1872444 RepID=UPI003AB38315